MTPGDGCDDSGVKIPPAQQFVKYSDKLFVNEV